VYLRTVVKGGSVMRLLGVWADLGYNKGSYSGFPNTKTSSGVGGSLGMFGGRLVSRSMSHNNAPPPHQQFQYVQCLSQENEVRIDAISFNPRKCTELNCGWEDE